MVSLTRVFMLFLIFISMVSTLWSQEYSKIVVSNTRSIELDYLVEAGENLSKVELYYTTDEGETWVLYGVDDDNMPPFKFTAKVDGLHGFKIVAYDKNGNHVDVPDSSTIMETPYFFDTVAPKVSLKSPSLGTIWRVGEMVNIEWFATDNKQDLPKEPVSIYYSMDKGHTWLPLFAKHPNIGSLVKELEVSKEMISAELLIKVVVVDFAGNFAESISDPVQVISQKDKVSEVYHVNLSDRMIARKYWEAGSILAGRGDDYDALLQYHKAVQKDPTKAVYHYDMAVVYKKIGDYKKAEVKYLDAIKIIDDRKAKSMVASEIYVGYIKFLHDLKEVNKEKEMIDKLLLIDPQNEHALWYLSLLYEERKNFEMAMDIWQKLSVSERHRPEGFEFPVYSIWRISAQEKIMKYKNMD